MLDSLFEEIAPEEFPNIADTARGRVSYPIIKNFLETEFKIGKLNTQGLGRSAANLKALLGSYITTHQYPIKIVVRRGSVYLVRLDLDDAGNKISDWKEKYYPDAVQQIIPNKPVQELTSELVNAKFEN